MLKYTFRQIILLTNIVKYVVGIVCVVPGSTGEINVLMFFLEKCYVSVPFSRAHISPVGLPLLSYFIISDCVLDIRHHLYN